MFRILIIEDDDSFREILQDKLEQAGYEVTGAPDGKAGLRLYREAPSDVVITDIFMPEKEGLETISELKHSFPDVKIIAMSGGGMMGAHECLHMAKKLGACKALTKPFELREMLVDVEELRGQGIGQAYSIYPT